MEHTDNYQPSFDPSDYPNDYEIINEDDFKDDEESLIEYINNHE